jgi:DNA mismatch endonuclease Vsr
MARCCGSFIVEGFYLAMNELPITAWLGLWCKNLNDSDTEDLRMGSAGVRRRTMQVVKSKGTAPELTVRRLAHRLGYRFRLHQKDLPGAPDLVFPSLHKVLFVCRLLTTGPPSSDWHSSFYPQDRLLKD